MEEIKSAHYLYDVFGTTSRFRGKTRRKIRILLLENRLPFIDVIELEYNNFHGTSLLIFNV